MNIWYSTPGRGDKNIGKAFNDFCSLIKDDEDWICLRDGDTMFLQPFWTKQIEDVIAKHGSEYQLFGCMTNRLNDGHQLHLGKRSEETDIMYHKQVADYYFKDHYDEVGDAPFVAGMFLLFQKKLWNEIKFLENSIHFDRLFSESVKGKGYKIGLLKGLYIFHYYRMGSSNPGFDYKHLLP